VRGSSWRVKERGDELGLEPAPPPKSLPPITADDIHLMDSQGGIKNPGRK